MTRNKTIDNSEDIIDSWDVIARIYDLESERGGLVDAIESAKNELVEFETAHPEWALVGEDSESREYLHDTLTNATEALTEWDESDEATELKDLQALDNEASGSGDWRHGETLIRDTYFEDYARQTAEDIGALKDANHWPCTCIDWEKAADELKQDYTSVEFGDTTYWIRS